MSVDASSKRVDVTLRTDTSTKKSIIDVTVFNKLHVGDVISGQIRRIEPYGLFITILPTNVVCSNRNLNHQIYQYGVCTVSKCLMLRSDF